MAFWSSIFWRRFEHKALLGFHSPAQLWPPPSPEHPAPAGTRHPVKTRHETEILNLYVQRRWNWKSQCWISKINIGLKFKRITSPSPASDSTGSSSFSSTLTTIESNLSDCFSDCFFKRYSGLRERFVFSEKRARWESMLWTTHLCDDGLRNRQPSLCVRLWHPDFWK